MTPVVEKHYEFNFHLTSPLTKVMPGDHPADGIPLDDGDVGGVQQGVHVHDVPSGHGVGMQLGQPLELGAKGPLLRRIALGRAHHADRAAGVDHQYLLVDRHMGYLVHTVSSIWLPSMATTQLS